jgi:ABC-2 family transporter protein
MNSFASIIKVDYLQRTRSYAFLITMLASICLAYTFLPPEGANYSTVRVGEYVGVTNAAWAGCTTAIMSSVFLWLIGFYLVNNSISRDVETGVGQIVATSSVSNFKYLSAKAMSNFFVLLTIMIIVMLMAAGLVIARGSKYPFDVFQFLSPYIFLTVPSLFCVSALAVFAEVFFGRYTVLQNVGFFFLFGAFVSLVNTSTNPSMHWLDIMGTKTVTDNITDIVHTNYGNTKAGASVGFMIGTKLTKKYFLFEGNNWTAVYILSRILWIGIGFIFLFIAAKFFHRFDVKERMISRKKISAGITLENAVAVNDIHLSALPKATASYGILPFIKIEVKMLLRKGPKWFWLINAGGFIALWFIPLKPAHQIALPVLWFLQVNRWADISTRDKYNRTHYFTYAAYKPLQRLLSSQIIAGSLLSMVLAFPLLLRYAVAGNYTAVVSILLGAIFVVSFAVCSGIVTGGKRFFEIIFFILTYINVNLAPPFDYFGAFNSGINYTALMLIIIFSMLSIAFLFRRYEIRNQ